MPIPDMEHDFTMRMKFHSANVHGLSKFRIDHIESDLSSLKVSVGISFDELKVLGKYSTSSWFQTSKGNFNVTLLRISGEGEVLLLVDEEGYLQIDHMTMDVRFEDIIMQFENLGALGRLFQVCLTFTLTITLSLIAS